jgi:hypothetical protein
VNQGAAASLRGSNTSENRYGSAFLIFRGVLSWAAAVRLLQILFSRRAITHLLRVSIFILVLITGMKASWAQSPEDVARGLGRRVAEIREVPDKVTVEWTNISSLPEPESIILRQAFLQELSSHRQVLAAEASATIVQVWVRETPTDFLLVARVAGTSGEQVRMAGVARTAFLPVMTQGNGLRLAKQLLWQQAETILDAVEFAEHPAGTMPTAATNGAANHAVDIFILRPDAVAVYREADERLSEIQELPFNGYRYASRALRGEMRRSKDESIVVELPGLTCTMHGPALAGERWTMQCGTAPTSTPTSASVLATTSTLATTAGSSPMISADMATITISSSCDANSWRLLQQSTDWTSPDRLLLVNEEMRREEAVAALDFTGPVRHLSGAEDGKSALAVVFNLASGSYEVYRIAVACGR